MTEIQFQLPTDRAALLFLLAAFVTPCTAQSQQPAVLTPDAFSIWEDSWVQGEVNELWITDVDPTGFNYSLVERIRPNSPNIDVYEEGRAFFLGPVTARSQETGDTFTLRIVVDDRHDREITYQGAIYQHPRTTFRAGFDCDRAGTPVELAICGNELLAAGDRELNRIYRELLEALPPERQRALRSEQRAWLTRRNRECLDGNDVITVCLARLYSDRLVATARLSDPALGAGPLFDTTYITAISTRDVELHQDLPIRLAMFPHDTDCSTTNLSLSPNAAVLVEYTCYSYGLELWPPIDLDFPIAGYHYSVMLFVDSNGMVWTAMHTEIDMSLDYQELVELALRSGDKAWRIWDDAGQSHFSIRSETGFNLELAPSCLDNFTERDHALATATDPPRMPDLVNAWVSRHPVLTGDRMCCCG